VEVLPQHQRLAALFMRYSVGQAHFPTQSAPRRTQTRSQAEAPSVRTRAFPWFMAGAAYRTRTCDPRITKASDEPEIVVGLQAPRHHLGVAFAHDPRTTHTQRKSGEVASLSKALS